MTSPRVSSARLDAAFANTCDPVFLLGADRRLLYVNRAWEELTGYSAESVIGLLCQPVSPTKGGDLVGLGGSFCPPPEALAGQSVSGVGLIIHARGDRRWRRIDFRPLRDSDGMISNLLGFIRDVEGPVGLPEAESLRVRYELLEVRHKIERRYGLEGLIGQGAEHRRLLEQVKSAASTTSPVAIVGEPGTGKRLVARTIHQAGSRRQHPLIPFDCGVLPPEVLERELFGSRRGGLVVEDGATLMLIDVPELHRDLQARLVEALDDRRRLLVTSRIDLADALRSERLRPDFYYLATTIELRLRPLRERFDEIPLLAQHFLERANQKGASQRLGFGTGAIEAFKSYDWPGNLHELGRVIETAKNLSQADLIQAIDLPGAIQGERGGTFSHSPLKQRESLDELLTTVERRLIEQALIRVRHNKSRAAELLGISRPRLYRRIKELNIPDLAEGAGEPIAEPN